MGGIKIGVPSKGRLKSATVEWLANYGIQLQLADGHREYSAKILGLNDVSIVLLSANEIPKELASGGIDLGITGQDLVREKIPMWREITLELKELNFGRAKLVLAVPKFWADVESLDDFDAVATSFRRKHGFRLRIATKYHNLVWEYLRQMGVADYQLIDSQGATEGSVKNNSAEAIADITSSGGTLEANHLKVIGARPILSSQATLYLSRTVKWNEKKYKVLNNFCSMVRIDPPDFLTN